MTQRARFDTTHWSVVLRAGDVPSDEARDALATLCAAYWLPIYVFARRQGAKEHEAQDLTQGFFAVLLEKGYLRAADRERGRFRTFLLTAFRRFASKERERAGALKRGGGRVHLSLDFGTAEERYRREPADGMTPERVFERRWALTLLDLTLARVRAHYERTGREDLYAQLEAFLVAGAHTPPYDEIAVRLGVSGSSIKSAIYRARRRYHDALREEIASTLPDDGDVDAEIRHLLDVLAG